MTSMATEQVAAQFSQYVYTVPGTWWHAESQDLALAPSTSESQARRQPTCFVCTGNPRSWQLWLWELVQATGFVGCMCFLLRHGNRTISSKFVESWTQRGLDNKLWAVSLKPQGTREGGNWRRPPVWECRLSILLAVWRSIVRDRVDKTNKKTRVMPETTFD